MGDRLAASGMNADAFANLPAPSIETGARLRG